jgi:paraquat-inducible protein A
LAQGGVVSCQQWSSVLSDYPLSSPVACPDCDLLQRIPPISPGDKACCTRCGCTLARKPVGSRDLPLALTVTAAIVFVIANTTRLMDLSAIGRSASTTIAGGAFEMWKNGQEITGLLVAFCAVLAPGGYIVFMLILLLGARRTPVPLWVGAMLRGVQYFETWSMLEVMMLGILVALIKIAELATVHAGIGMFAVGALILLFPAIVVTFDIRELWQRVEWDDDALPAAASAGKLAADSGR